MTVLARLHLVEPLVGLLSGHSQIWLTQAPPLHTWPQAPQSLTLLFKDVSQPHTLAWQLGSLRLLSQSPSAAKQSREHTPSAHCARLIVVKARRLHAAPQAPQLATLPFESVTFSLVSQPSSGGEPASSTAPLQSPQPESQRIAQAPPLQVGVPCAFEHTCPQCPQLFGSVFRFCRQAPTFSQSPKPGLHEETPHCPARQCGVPPFDGQVKAQLPQWVESELMSVSQPLSGSRSQSAKPTAQVGVHASVPAWTSPVHAVSPCALRHSTPHPPQ